MNLLTHLEGWLHRGQPLPEAVACGIDRAVEVTDTFLRTVPGYRQRLAPAVAHALDHCGDLVAALPGPIDVRASAFASDPLVHALFGAVDDIGAMLGRSRAVREFLASPSCRACDDFHALLGVRRHERNVMGMALWGDLVRGDSPQTLLYFSDHTLFGIARELEDTRALVRQEAFDSLLRSFADGLAERHLLLAEDKLAALAEWLAAAETHLRLEPVTVSVDAMGVEAEPGAPGAQLLRLVELIGRDRRRWSVVLGSFSRQETQAALERQEQAHRYLVI